MYMAKDGFVDENHSSVSIFHSCLYFCIGLDLYDHFNFRLASIAWQLAGVKYNF